MTSIDDQYFSQFGEDKILHETFGEKKDGFCIEVGGYDGITGSNTYFFEKLGWQCLVIEPIYEYCEKIRSARSCEVYNVAVSDEDGEAEFAIAEGIEVLSTMLSTLETNTYQFERIKKDHGRIKKIIVKTKTLNSILEAKSYPKIDFISIDVEGHEMEVLKGFSVEKFLPRIMIIEANSRKMKREISEYLDKFGYIRCNKTGSNYWFAIKTDREIVKRREILRMEAVDFVLPILRVVLPGFVRKFLKRLTS